MGGWTAEVWNLPHNDPHEVIISQLPALTVDCDLEFNGVGAFDMALPVGYERLDEIVQPDSDVQALVVLYWDTTRIGGFFPEEAVLAYSEEAGATVQVSGPGAAIMAKWPIVYNYDYPADPTLQPDHLYGGDSAGSFENGTFDENTDGFGGNGGGEGNSINPWKATSGDPQLSTPLSSPSISTDEADAGTHSIKIDPDQRHSGGQVKFEDLVPGGRYVINGKLKEPTASGLRYTAAIEHSSGTIHHTEGFRWNGYAFAELGNVARNSAKNGEPGGSADGTFQTFLLDVTLPSEQTEAKLVVAFDDHIPSPQAGLVAYLDGWSITGPGIGLQPWFDRDGNLDAFILDDARQQGGTHSMKLAFPAGIGASAASQEVEGLIVGVQYTFHAYASHDGGAEHILRLRVDEGALITTESLSIPTGSGFTSVTAITFVATTEEITLSLENGEASASPNFWIDTVTFAAGLPPGTVGRFFQDLMDDATVDHAADPRGTVLEFVDYESFTAVLDTDGLAWDDLALSMKFTRGNTYLQALSQVVALGYEWELVWNANPVPKFGPAVEVVGTVDTVTFDKPPDGKDGDYWYVVLCLVHGISDAEKVDPVPTGWSVIFNRHDTSGAGRLVGVFYREMADYDATPDTVTFTLDRFNVEVPEGYTQYIRGLPAGGPTDDFSVLQELQNMSDIDSPTITVQERGTIWGSLWIGSNSETGNALPVVIAGGGGPYVLQHAYKDRNHPVGVILTNHPGGTARYNWSGFPGTSDLSAGIISFKPVEPRWELRIYNPHDGADKGIGQDRSGDNTPAIHEGAWISAARVARSVPPVNAILAEGADGLWSESANATHGTKYSRREKYVGDDNALNNATVDALAVEQLALQGKKALGIKITLSEASHVLPMVHFGLGDTISVYLQSFGHTGAYRARRFQFHFAEPGASTFTIDFNSQQYEQAVAQILLLNRLAQKFEGLGSLATTGSISGGTAVAGSSIDYEVQPFFKALDLVVGNGNSRFVLPYDAEIIDVRAVVNTQPTGADVIVDVDKNGTTIFSTQANRPTVAASSNDSGLAVPDITEFLAGDYLQVNIDQIGSTIAGADLTVMVRFRRL